MDFQLLQYNIWESKHLVDHSTLLEKYNSLKQKENMMLEAKEGKTSKKDILLKHKANNTLTKLGNLDLENIEKEDVIQGNYNRNLMTITQRREKRIRDAEEEFEKAESYYNCEKDSSLAKVKREYESKKRTLESKGECIEQERNLSVKSASEITLEKQKYDILKQLQNNITTIQISRDQLPKDTSFNTSVPTLPEPLQNSTGPPPPSPPTKNSSTTNEMPAWLINLGEDSSLTLLREESRREDARIRREAAEEEMIRQEKALAYRRQLESEAADRKKEREAREKEVLKEEGVSHTTAKRPVKSVKKV
jgi:hypothetical protein